MKEPERIVSLSLNTDEILLELAGPSLVAITGFSDDPSASPSAQRAKKIRSRSIMSIEHLLGLKPDLVFLPMFAPVHFKEVLAQEHIATTDATVPSTLQELERNIKDIGKRLGQNKKAETMISNMKNKLERATLRATCARGRSILLVTPTGVAPGQNTLIDDVLTQLGLRNLARRKGSGHVQIKQEELLSLQPDFLLVSAYTADAQSRTPFGAEMLYPDSSKRLHVPDAYLMTTSHHIAETAYRISEAVAEHCTLGAAHP